MSLLATYKSCIQPLHSRKQLHNPRTQKRTPVHLQIYVNAALGALQVVSCSPDLRTAAMMSMAQARLPHAMLYELPAE